MWRTRLTSKVGRLRIARDAMKETIPQLLRDTADAHPSVDAQVTRSAEQSYQARTYTELLQAVKQFSSGLLSAGISRGDRVGFICDNRYEWLVCDIGILSIGAIDVPRGCDSSAKEISYILKTVECRTAIVETAEQLEKIVGIVEDLPSLEHVIVIDWSDKDEISTTTGAPFQISSLDDIMINGAAQMKEHPDRIDDEIEKGTRDDTATIIFTSGTTGEPKGVMLSHENFLHQIRSIPDVISTQPAEINLSVLPIWHSFERIMEYVIIGLACTIAYSKPVGKIMLADFAALRPHWMAAVPRVWEGIQSGICAKFKSKGAFANTIFRFFCSDRNLSFNRLVTGARAPRIGEGITSVDRGPYLDCSCCFSIAN